MFQNFFIWRKAAYSSVRGSIGLVENQRKNSTSQYSRAECNTFSLFIIYEKKRYGSSFIPDMTLDILFQNGKTQNLDMTKIYQGMGNFSLSQRITILAEYPPEN